MSPPATLQSAAKTFWRDFLGAWLVPVVAAASTAYQEFVTATIPRTFVEILIMAFLVAFMWWMRLYLARRIRYRHAIMLGMCVPFAIWILLLALLRLARFISFAF